MDKRGYIERTSSFSNLIFQRRGAREFQSSTRYPNTSHICEQRQRTKQNQNICKGREAMDDKGV
jgi:hypothetical protein